MSFSLLIETDYLQAQGLVLHNGHLKVEDEANGLRSVFECHVVFIRQNIWLPEVENFGRLLFHLAKTWAFLSPVINCVGLVEQRRLGLPYHFMVWVLVSRIGKVMPVRPGTPIFANIIRLFGVVAYPAVQSPPPGYDSPGW